MQTMSKLLILGMTFICMASTYACCPCPTGAMDNITHVTHAPSSACTAEEKAALTCFDFNYGDYNYKVQTVTGGSDSSFPVKVNEHVYQFEYEVVALNGGPTPITTISQSGTFTNLNRRQGKEFQMDVIDGTPSTPTLTLYPDKSEYTLSWTISSEVGFHFSVQTNMPSKSVTLPTRMTIRAGADGSILGSGTIIGPTDDTPEWNAALQSTVTFSTMYQQGTSTCTVTGNELNCVDPDGKPFTAIRSEDIKCTLAGKGPYTLRSVEMDPITKMVLMGFGDSPGCNVSRLGGSGALYCPPPPPPPLPKP